MYYFVVPATATHSGEIGRFGLSVKATLRAICHRP